MNNRNKIHTMQCSLCSAREDKGGVRFGFKSRI